MSEREDLGFELLLLARHHTDDPGRDLKPASLSLVDRVATYTNLRHHTPPQAVSTLLNLAMHAAMRGDTSGVIHHLEIALSYADAPPSPPPKTRVEPKAPAKEQPQPSSAVITTKPVGETIDPLLAKLRAKHPKR